LRPLTKMLAGVAVSLLAIAIISILFGVDFGEVLSVNPLYLILLSSAATARLLLQGLRFHLIASEISGRKLRLVDSVMARVGSEFVALSTVAYIGGEFVRAAWLKREGEPMGRALFVPYEEILCDVLVGSAISIAASVLIIGRSFYLALLVMLVSLANIGAYSALIFLSLKGKGEVRLGWLRRLMGRRGEALEEKLNEVVRGFSSSARESLPKWGLLLKVLLLTILICVISGLILMLSLSAFGCECDLLASIMAVYASLALSSLPVTVGGSGLSELGTYYYLNAIAPQGWEPVILWRIASYYVPLLESGAALSYLIFKGLVDLDKA